MQRHHRHVKSIDVSLLRQNHHPVNSLIELAKEEDSIDACDILVTEYAAKEDIYKKDNLPSKVVGVTKHRKNNLTCVVNNAKVTMEGLE